MGHFSFAECNFWLIVFHVMAFLEHSRLLINVAKVKNSFVSNDLVHVVHRGIEFKLCVDLLHLNVPQLIRLIHVMVELLSILLAEFSFDHVLEGVGYLIFTRNNSSNQTGTPEHYAIDGTKLKRWLKCILDKG
jgi:hypothetical protein